MLCLRHMQWQMVSAFLLGQPAVRNAVLRQRGQCGQAQLNRVVAEHIGHQCVQLRALPAQQVLACGGMGPALEIYNWRTHEINTAACVL